MWLSSATVELVTEEICNFYIRITHFLYEIGNMTEINNAAM